MTNTIDIDSPDNSGPSSDNLDDVYKGIEDPVLFEKLALEKNGNKRGLQVHRNIWLMILSLHARLESFSAENTAQKNKISFLEDQVKHLSDSLAANATVIADVRDEHRSFKQTIAAEVQTIGTQQANQPTMSSSNQVHQPKKHTYATTAATNNRITTNNGINTSVVSFQDTRTGTTSDHSLAQQAPRISQDAQQTDDEPSEQKQAHVDQPYTEVNRQRHPRAIRGNYRPHTNEENSTVDDGLFNLLKLSHPAHKDFFIRGIPNVEHTGHKDGNGQPNVVQYGNAIKAEIERKGIQVRFVKVLTHYEGDLRNTTGARIGCYKADEEKVMSGKIWPRNVTVRPWKYEDQSKNQQRW